MASVVLSFGGKEIKTYELTKPATVVGRDQTADIVIDNLGVSRGHCQFLRRGTAFVIQDMNSSNGTFVNGAKVGEHYLNDQDQVVVGKYALTFHNEQQAVAPAEKIVPDSLNTYMMDGNKIKERLEEMRREQEAKAPAPTPDPAAVFAPAPAAPEAAGKRGGVGLPDVPSMGRVERHTKIIMGDGKGERTNTKTLKMYLIISLVLNLVLIAACAFTFYYFFFYQAE